MKTYGWKPQRPDYRDYKLSLGKTNKRPSKIDSLTLSIPAYDQGDLGSCTGNGCGALWQYRLSVEKLDNPLPSRLFIYYNERVLEGTVREDSGANVRDGLKALAKWGCCPETIWPYDIKSFSKKPSKKAYTTAIKDAALEYHAVTASLDALRNAIAFSGPVVGGFTVFQSFESDQVAQTGIMPMPAKNEKPVGGHCVVWDGYDDVKRSFFCRNSWGSKWGMNGWFTMPYENLPNCSDFWVLLKVS